MAFQQPDREMTFSELFGLFVNFQLGASVIGVLSLAGLMGWDKWKPLKESVTPALWPWWRWVSELVCVPNTSSSGASNWRTGERCIGRKGECG